MEAITCLSLDPQDPAKFLLGPTTPQITDMLGNSDSQVGLEIRINLPSSTWQLLWNSELSVQGSRDSNDIAACNRGHTIFLSCNTSPEMCGIYVLPNTQPLWDSIQYVSALFLSNIDHGAERKKYGQSWISSPPASCLRLPWLRKRNLHK